MKEGMDKESMATYNRINLDSYKSFFEQSQDFPFDTQNPLETVIEYYDFILELLDSIEIPTKFEQTIIDKEVLLENLNNGDLTQETAIVVINRLNSITECVNDVIEKRS